MRGKERKTKIRENRAERRTVEEVITEILPQGPKIFPQDFFSAKAAACAKSKIDLPDQPLIFDNSPIFKSVYVKDSSFSHQVKNPAEGKYLLYAQLAGHDVALIPDKTVELTRTVANYEKYLRELRKKHPNPQKCQCCGRNDRRMILDHDHKTKKFRGWLCGHCNTAIGFMDDDVSQLKKAILYLERV